MSREITKSEAIEQMKKGVMITHKYFGEDEWMKSNQSGSIIILEDGVEISPNEFWEYRSDKAWDDGYYPYTNPELLK